MAEKTKKRFGFFKALKISFFLVFVLLCSVIIFFNVTHDYHVVSGASMQPTLNKEDSVDGVFVSKIKSCRRGDIIVSKAISEAGEEILVIKRLIAVAGDKIKVEEINGEYRIILIYAGDDFQTVLEETYLTDYSVNERLYEKFNIMIALKNLAKDENGFITISDGYVFYLGDNRTDSRDCSNYGEVKTENLVGRVDYIAYGNKNIYLQVIDQFFGW